MAKEKYITDYWEKEVCGTRYIISKDKSKNYSEIIKARYKAEPYIKKFAFGDNNEILKNKKVLEIGVGAGSDFIGFLKRGAICYGIDATQASINETRKNISLALEENDYKLEFLEKVNAEKLPFDDNTFDLVYSHGVLHHAENTLSCIAEAIRVLKSRGKLKLMVYSTFSCTGLMLWGIHGLTKLKLFASQEDLIFKYLESPGTKCYSKKEFRKILTGFGMQNIKIDKHVNAGDLLFMPPSVKHNENPFYKIIQKIYPRFLVKKFENILGLALTAQSIKK